MSVNGQLDDVRPGDPIRAFCPGCERTVEVAAPRGIGSFHRRADELVATKTEFPA